MVLFGGLILKKVGGEPHYPSIGAGPGRPMLWMEYVILVLWG